MFYKYLLRPLLFAFSWRDPELAHDLVLGLFRLSQSWEGLLDKAQILKRFPDTRLGQRLWNIYFPSPVGTAAGFDKNAVAVRATETWLRVGFVEVGSVTRLPQKGYDRPRITRLSRDRALINQIGLENDGADAVAEHLAQSGVRTIPLIASIVGVGIVPPRYATELAANCRYVLRQLYPHGDVFSVNISSPSIPEFRLLREKQHLMTLLQGLTEERELLRGQYYGLKPLLVKLSPDLTREELRAVLDTCLDCHVNGVIATNATVSREGLCTLPSQPGGVSGRPLYRQALEVVRFVYQHTGGRLPIIGVGGIFSAEDAYAMVKAGASLVQVYAGLVYEGPSLPWQINQGLVRLLERDGFTHISRAVGVDAR